jgi:hypothetical protein
MTDKPQRNQEESKETTQQYRPKTAGGNKNQGQPQGNQTQKPRPETAANKNRNDGANDKRAKGNN